MLDGRVGVFQQRERLGVAREVGVDQAGADRAIGEAPLDETAGKLSTREREVLAWVAAGRRQADIAATLGLSGRTVENHLRSARRHLGVAKIAIRKGEIKG